MTEKMRSAGLIGYVTGALLSWWLVAGLFYADDMGQFVYCTAHRQAHHEPEARGSAIAIGFLYAAIWPAGVPLAFTLSGGGYFGIWRNHKERWYTVEQECR